MQTQNPNKGSTPGLEQPSNNSLDESTISDYLNIERSIAKITGSFKAFFNSKRVLNDQKTGQLDHQSNPDKLRGVHSFNDTRLQQNRGRKSNMTNMLKVSSAAHPETGGERQ
jgi:hypothetical protein